MLNQVHISKRMGKGFISDFGIAFFHTLYRLSHWQLSWKSNFQSVVIHVGGRDRITVIHNFLYPSKSY